MADSLRDQLVKAGLATAAQAKKAERQARADKATRGKSKPGERESEASALARQARAEKAERDRAAAEAIREKAAAKALRAEIKQIIRQHDQRVKTAHEDDVPYNFVHGKKIKRIYVPAAQREQLSSGRLVIVNDDGIYHLVSKSVAERIRARDPKRIIAAHGDKAPEPGSDDEFYARFEVPDDLDW
ncbi:MAG: DUF2058 domain-containing protein [Pseudomonadales bacterium]